MSSSPKINSYYNKIPSEFFPNIDYSLDKYQISKMEEVILNSKEPLEIKDSEEIILNGQKNILLNKNEILNWKGVIPISEYSLNSDLNPLVITKKSNQQLDFIQELALRYLRPPTPPAPGEIIINQQANVLTPPAPPLIIRQQPARPDTPEPLVIREAPPAPPAQVGRKVITISGKRLPPAPRKVIIERLAQLPSKPQSVLIERWLPYAQVKRRVIFNRANQADPVVVRPRNVIVQWETPRVNIKQEYKYLGVIKANPVEYVQRYGSTLRHSNELPQFVHDIKTPEGLVLAANYQYNNLHELYGDVSALNLIDLEKEGLGAYRNYKYFPESLEENFSNLGNEILKSVNKENKKEYFEIQRNEKIEKTDLEETEDLIEQLFSSLDPDQCGKVSIIESQNIALRLCCLLEKKTNQEEIKSIFISLDSDNDRFLSRQEFKIAFQTLSDYFLKD